MTLRVIIVDDRPHSRNGLKALLATFDGIEVIGEATNGQEAVCLVGNCRPDVILIDIRMPVMDGLEATRMIKNNWPETKVIVLTLYPEYLPDSKTAGADAFLVKGCPADELFKTIVDE